MYRGIALALCLSALSGCATPSTPAPPARMAESGLDLTSFDKSVRPQDDLFLHVNGDWLKKTAIPADKASYGAFDLLFDQAQADLRAIVEEASKSTTKAPGSEAQKIGDFYDSFMDEARVESLGLTPLKDRLAAIDAIQTKADLARQFAQFFKMNLINPLVGYVEGDAQQPTQEILYVYQGGLGLPDRDYYLKDDARLKEYREKYVGFLQSVLQMAGDNAANKSAREIFVLETRLARAHWTNVENRDAVKTYNKVAVADLVTQFPGFDWAAWTAELGISGLPAMVVAQPSYLKALAAAVNELPVDRWKPYLKASLVNGFAPYLSKFFNLDADDAVNFVHQFRSAPDASKRRPWSSNPWPISDEAEYQKRAKVLVEQFNQFEPLPGLHVNGELSLKGAPAPVVDGLPAGQRFYMGWAQSWMAKQRDESLRQQVLTNVHSPEMYRANGPIRNVPEFYAAFGLKEGDKLFLPADRRVKIW